MKAAILFGFIYLFSFNIHCQNILEKVQDSIFRMIQTQNEKFVVQHGNQIIWRQIDYFNKFNPNARIRGRVKLDTLTITLSFEEHWDSLTIQKVKKQNKSIIDEMSSKYLHYMDSINWRGYKITRHSFDSDKVLHLKMNHPRIFNQSEMAKIKQIKRCPDFLVDGIGIFLDEENVGIEEENIRKEYHDKLRFIRSTIFKSSHSEIGKEIYE